MLRSLNEDALGLIVLTGHPANGTSESLEGREDAPGAFSVTLTERRTIEVLDGALKSSKLGTSVPIARFRYFVMTSVTIASSVNAP